MLNAASQSISQKNVSLFSSLQYASSLFIFSPRRDHLLVPQGEVEVGIDSLSRAREKDPYRNPAKRLLYERVRGKAAPSFTPPDLDAAVDKARLAREKKLRPLASSSRTK